MAKPHEGPNIDVIVVVSGSPTPVRVNLHQSLGHLVAEALRASGSVGQPASEWELRSEAGALLDLQLRIQQAGISAGDTLFLSPAAGAGG